jgi:hypothetical protein
MSFFVAKHAKLIAHQRLYNLCSGHVDTLTMFVKIDILIDTHSVTQHILMKIPSAYTFPQRDYVTKHRENIKSIHNSSWPHTSYLNSYNESATMTKNKLMTNSSNISCQYEGKLSFQQMIKKLVVTVLKNSNFSASLTPSDGTLLIEISESS